MTISFLAISTKAAGVGTVALQVPGAVGAGDIAIAGRAYSVGGAKAPAGWINAQDRLGGTGNAVDNHQTRARVDYRTLTGVEGPPIVFEQTPGADGAIGVMATYRRTAGRGWDVVSSSGDDATHATDRTVAGTALPLAPGDVVVAVVATDTDTILATFGAPAITAPGITFGATSRRTTSSAGTANGLDYNIEVLEATVTAGTATAVPTVAFTTTTLQCGPAVFVRLREIPSVVSGWRPTTEDLLELRGVPRRFDDFRFQLVDRRNNPLGDVHPDLDKAPAVTWDTSRPIHRTLDSFYLPASETDQINPLTDRVRVFQTLQNGAEFSLGVFLWADANRPRRPWGFETQGTLLDKTYVLEQPLISSQSLPRTTTALVWFYDHVTAIPEFNINYQIEPDFRADYVATVVLYMLVVMGEDGLSKEIGSPVNWQGGTTHLKMGNDIMGLVNYLPLHCDRDGVLQMRRARPIETVVPTLNYGFGRKIIEQSYVESVDLLSAPNYVVVTDNTANQTPISGVWRAPASAPHSEVARGYAVGKYETMSGLATPEEAAAEARRRGEYLMQAGSWKEFLSPADPRHGEYEIIGVEGERMLETRWRIVCVSGQPMSHRALRVYPEDPL